MKINTFEVLRNKTLPLLDLENKAFIRRLSLVSKGKLKQNEIIKNKMAPKRLKAFELLAFQMFHYTLQLFTFHLWDHNPIEFYQNAYFFFEPFLPLYNKLDLELRIETELVSEILLGIRHFLFRPSSHIFYEFNTNASDKEVFIKIINFCF